MTTCERCNGTGWLDQKQPLKGQQYLFEAPPIPCANCCQHRPRGRPWVTCARCELTLLAETYRNYPADSWLHRIENGKAVYQYQKEA